MNLAKTSETLKQSNINVTVFNGTALLTGQVPDQATQSAAQQVVADVRGVKKVENALSVAGATSLGVRANDAYLTTAVNAVLAKEVVLNWRNEPRSQRKMEPYLMGFLTGQEIEAVTMAAQTVGGVERIVALFERID